MLLKQIDHKGKIENGKVYQLDVFELGRYEVRRNVTKDKSGKLYKNYSVSNKGAKFLPDIYYNDGFFENEKPSFTIQTTAYGALNVKEIDEVIAGYKEAQQAVEILTLNFC